MMYLFVNVPILITLIVEIQTVYLLYPFCPPTMKNTTFPYMIPALITHEDWLIILGVSKFQKP